MNRKAFTLIELLVVVAIIGILAAVGVVAYNGYTASAKVNIVKRQVDDIEKFLLSKGIQSRRYYPTPLHKTETYKDKGSYPNAEYCSNEGLAIPVHQYLTSKEVSSIIKTIKEAI